ncbi:MAG: SH3 domain-containing protein [Gammaproteobacteria bacterium]|nr:SH3 domain-containing protein [Gammaproteobacteria bacterium]
MPKILRTQVLVLILGLLSGCGALGLGQSQPEPEPPPETVAVPITPSAEKPAESEVDRATYRQINRYQVAKLRRDTVRLQEAVERAEQALSASESSVGYTSADAISALAEAQVQAQGTVNDVPWRREELQRAREKLDVAKQYIDARNYSAAMYFVYRANQTMSEAREEARLVRDNPAVLYVKGKRVNVREGPSTKEPVITVVTRDAPVLNERKYKQWRLVKTTDGLLGWIYAPLLTSTKPVALR